MLGGGSIQTASWQAGLQRVEQVLASLGDGLDRLTVGASRVHSLLTADRPVSVSHAGPLGYAAPLPLASRQESPEGPQQTSLGRGETNAVRSMAVKSPLWPNEPWWEKNFTNNASASADGARLTSRLGHLLATTTRLLNRAFEPEHAPSSQAASQETPQRYFPREPGTLDPRDARSHGQREVLAASNINVHANEFKAASAATHSTLSQRPRVDRISKLPVSLLPISVNATHEARPSAQAWQAGKNLAPEFQLNRPEWTRLIGLVSATHEAIRRLEAREPTAMFG